MTKEDLCRFMVAEGSFDVGEAVYGNEDAVKVRASWLEEAGERFLVFGSDPDAMESSAYRREAQSWVLRVSDEMLRALLDLAEFL